MNKRILGLFLAILCATLLCFTAACNMRGKIESVNGHSTIYRHKVKAVYLINAESENHEVLQAADGFKYYYSTSDYLLFKEHTFSYFSTDYYEYYFPELEFNDGYCETHKCETEILILFDGVDKEYRPSYSVKNDIATIEYFEAQITGSYAFKQELDYEAVKKIEQEVTQKQLDLRNDEEALEKYISDVTESYKYAQAIFSQKISISLTGSSALTVTYHQ